MACPFPGMDPYLEIPPYWSDFSPAFLTAIRNRLIPTLLPKYDVRLEEYLLLEHGELPNHRVRPDVVVSSHGQGDIHVSGTLTMPQSATTQEVEYPDFDPTSQRRLVLTNRSSGRVITIIELLSPINKSPGQDGIEAYERKREELLTTSCHLIELDLLRGGERLPIKGTMPPGDYFAYVGRSHRRPTCQIIGWGWKSELPPIPLPLLPEDGEIQLDLASSFRDAYEPAYYEKRLPYERTLHPKLSEAELVWIKSRIKHTQ